MISSIFQSRIDWNGITLEISYEPCWSTSMVEVYGSALAHLQIRAIAPDRAVLPITETGYRSHFVAADEVTEMGGYLEYARAWLDHAAQSPAWRAQCEAARQLALF